MTVEARRSDAGAARDWRDVRMCTDKRVPRERAADAEAAALAERPDNLRVARVPGGGPSRPRMAIIVATEWKPGSDIHVRFMDGDPAIQRRVEARAQEWEEHANLRFVFDDRTDAEIRISFLQEGSWSYLGKDALQIPVHEPTMNYGWLTPTSEDEEVARVVLHEFGHAMGAVHEHQSPAVTIPWDAAAVYAYYAQQGWSKDDVDQNVLIPYSPAGIQFSVFDPESIMLYAVDDRLTIGDFAIDWNTSLSEMDKSFIRSRYPREEKPIVELAVDGPTVEGDVSKPGEVDWYQFAVAKAGSHVVETTGGTDVVMSLHGPNKQTSIIAADDDSGRGLNARIVRELDPATYFVQVRHYGPAGTGGYKVGVKQSRRRRG